MSPDRRVPGDSPNETLLYMNTSAMKTSIKLTVYLTTAIMSEALAKG